MMRLFFVLVPALAMALLFGCIGKFFAFAALIMFVGIGIIATEPHPERGEHGRRWLP